MTVEISYLRVKYSLPLPQSTSIPKGSIDDGESSQFRDRDEDPDGLSEEVDLENLELDLDNNPENWKSEYASLGKICKKKPLPSDEVIQLAMKIEAGVFAQERLDQGLEQPDWYRNRLEMVIADGQAAFDHLFECNMRLVLYWAMRMVRETPLEDRFQAGCFGLIRAIQKFDHRMGFTFGTYASSWIRQSIDREANNSDTIIRTPVYVHEQLRFDREVGEIRWKVEDKNTTFQSEWIRHLYRPIDFDLVTEDLRFWWCSIEEQEDRDSDLVYSELARQLSQIVMHELMVRRPTKWEQDLNVIRSRYGLTTGEGMTLDAIGQKFGFTRERSRQILDRTLEVLGLSTGIIEMADLLDVVMLPIDEVSRQIAISRIRTVAESRLEERRGRQAIRAKSQKERAALRALALPQDQEFTESDQSLE